MGLVAVGISHKTAPVELRERFTIPHEQMGPSLDRLFSLGEFQEAVILSTCNRLEVYARPKQERSAALKAATQFFHSLYGNKNLERALYRFEGTQAVEHLFRVAAGLDSMVVGETEILGQVKSAYVFSQSHGCTGKITNVLFQRALFVGKQVRTKTTISEGASSVGSIAVQLAERIFGPLHQHRILLLGAGEIAEITARHLLSQKAGEIVILNRTLERARDLAKTFKGEAGPLDALEAELLKADIVICSTASDKPLITKKMIGPLMKVRRGRSLYFVDIAVPRNVEPKVHGIDNAYVYNIDDLQELIQENMARRKNEVKTAETLVTGLAQEFYDWIKATLDGKVKALRHGL